MYLQMVLLKSKLCNVYWQVLSDADNANSAEAQRNPRESAITTAGILGLGQKLKKTGEKTKTAKQDVKADLKMARCW